MKHLKTFENYSAVNEEEIFGAVRKFATGHESSDDKQSAKKEFESELDRFEAEASTDDNVVFNRANLEKQAAENNYLGSLEYRTSARDNKEYVFYKRKLSGLQDLAGKAASKRNNPLN